MKLFSKIAYHSTKQKGLNKFDSFTSNEKAYKGEGAQVHGWGLYLQEDKERNTTRYKERLGKAEFKVTVTLTNKKTGDVNSYSNINQMDNKYSHPRFDVTGNFEKFLQFCYYHTEDDKREYVKHQMELLKDEDSDFYIELVNRYKDYLNYLDMYDCKVEKNVMGVSQYEVEIPDDFVFLDEEAPIDKQNILMLPSLLEEYNLTSGKELSEIIKEFKNKYPQVNPNIFGAMAIGYEDFWTIDKMDKFLSMHYGYEDWGYTLKDMTTEDNYKEANKSIQYIIEDFLDKVSNKTYVTDGRELYEALCNILGNAREVSELLCKYGIDGISYDGRQDGKCYVIFNCKELKILSEE